MSRSPYLTSVADMPGVARMGISECIALSAAPPDDACARSAGPQEAMRRTDKRMDVSFMLLSPLLGFPGPAQSRDARTFRDAGHYRRDCSCKASSWWGPRAD